MRGVIPEGLAFREHVLLKDGQGLLLRPATAEDVPLVSSLMARVSRESLRMRFMAAVSEVAEPFIRDLCGGNFTDRGCLLAVVTEEGGERVVGLGNYVGVGNGRTAEVAFLVEDAYQGRGISTLVLERLAGLAAANGYVDLEAEVLPENQAMLGVFEGSGFAVHRVWGTDTVHVELPVDGAGAFRERAELRERIAVANSLVPLLRPRAVAVAGASREAGAIGNLIFRNLLASEFAGAAYPVNPLATAVHSVRAYRSLDDLPEPIDLAVVAVPAEAAQAVVEGAIAAGARGLVVVSAGFAEAGPEGAERQRRLLELVRAHGVRLVGPSCLGVMNTDPRVRLNATAAPSLAPGGRIGFFSHSAALGLVILEHAAQRGIGFSTFVSAGNRADVSGNDLLQYWEEDPGTEIGMLYLETFGNPRRFARIARRVSTRKPILCVKGARSRAGRRTAEARSGMPGAEEREVEALFEQTGVIRAETLDELFDVAVLLAHQPLPAGDRVAVVANSAGVTTLLADACEANGLTVSGVGAVNLGAFATPSRYRATVEEILGGGGVDSLIVAFASFGEGDPGAFTDAVCRGVHAARALNCGAGPVLLCIMGETGSVSWGDGADRAIFPAYRFPESAPRALSKVLRYSEFRRQPPGQIAWYDDVDAAAARRLVIEWLERGAGAEGVTLESRAVGQLLAAFGLTLVEAGEEGLPIRVHHDPLFGPLLEVASAAGPAVERITPLTDRDVAQVLASVGLAGAVGVGEAIGRVSQMVEELPWIWSIEGRVARDGPPALMGTAEIRVCRVTTGREARS